VKESGLPLPILAGVGAGVLVILIVAIIVIRVSMKRNRSSSASIESQAGEADGIVMTPEGISCLDTLDNTQLPQTLISESSLSLYQDVVQNGGLGSNPQYMNVDLWASSDE
jgi:hypothetical protein